VKFEALTKTFSKKNLPNSEVELTGEVPYDVVQSYREHALEHIAKELEMPGFRKGHVPQDLALKKVGEVAVLEEAVEHFVRDFYPELALVQKLDVVGRPHIQLTKLAPGNPVGLTIRAALYPEVTLPKDWRSIAAKVPLLPYTGELPKADPPPAPEEEQKAREYMAKSAHRGKIIDALLEKVSVEVPTIFIESELDKIISQMKEDVAQFGVKYEDYLKQISKTEDQLRGEFREHITSTSLIVSRWRRVCVLTSILPLKTEPLDMLRIKKKLTFVCLLFQHSMERKYPFDCLRTMFGISHLPSSDYLENTKSFCFPLGESPSA
jgi:hypothetical protein